MLLRRATSLALMTALVTTAGVFTAPAASAGERPQPGFDLRDLTAEQRLLGPSTADAPRERGGVFATPSVEMPKVERVEDIGSALATTTLARWRAQASVFSMRELLARAGTAADGDPSTGGIDRYVLDAADLDGDGLDDLFAAEVAISAELDLLAFDLVALRGTDGTELWRFAPLESFDVADLLFRLGPDLDADGIRDILTLTLTIGDELPCVVAVIVGACVWSEVPLLWDLRARDGGSSQAAWSRTIDGAATVVFASGGVGFAAVEQITAAAVIPFEGGDLDGEPGDDLVLDIIDVDDVIGAVFAPAVFALAATARYTTTAERVHGDDGTSIGSASRSSNEMVPFAVGAGQAVGDPIHDLVWITEPGELFFVCAFTLVGTCAYEGVTPLTVEMVDGTTGASTWTWQAAAASYAMASLPVGDVNGDDASDLLVLDGSGIGLLSGADGSRPWSHQAYGVALAGNIDGGVGQDLVFVDWRYEAYEETLIDRVDGVDGSLLSTSAYPEAPPTGEIYTEVYLPGDLDADGVIDLGYLSYDYDLDAVLPPAFRSGRTNAIIEFATTLDEASFLGIGDVDADGGDDLLFFSASYGPSSIQLTEELSTGGEGPRWQRSLVLTWESYYDLVFAEADPQPGIDLFSDRVQFLWSNDDGGLTIESSFDQRSGLTGERAWVLGQDPTPPAGGGGGDASISGTVQLEDQRAFPYICIDVFDPSGGFIGWVEAFGTGEYTVEGLAAGSYHVRFTDCGERIHISEWWQDAATFEGSAAITLGDGEAREGIDAELALAPLPANDASSAASEITAPASVTAITLRATTAGTDLASCGEIGRTVWYRFTPSSTDTYTLDSFGSDFDTIIAVYAGAPGGTEVACNDDAGDGFASMVSVEAVAGVSYYVMAGGFYGDAGNLVLNLA